VWDNDSSVIREIKNRRWTISLIEYGEEWDTDRYDDYVRDNDYDIDNDRLLEESGELNKYARSLLNWANSVGVV
jgi:hypothetical protein